MGIGSGLLVVVAMVIDGVPRLALSSWLVVVWLAVVNTALAFTVWNYTMRRLSAMESSLINNTMLVHVTVLAWIFLGERPNPRNMLGLALVLQPHLAFASLVVCASGSGLMASAPA
jgi:drug/metabolite transporter (DMT)-like permease